MVDLAGAGRLIILPRIILHFILHAVMPGAVSKVLFPSRWKRAWLIMMLTMMLDLDHLLADTLYDPNRCSINFHPLHSFPAIVIYVVLTAIGKTRIVGLGLLIHILLDGLDCLWMQRL